jgi:hypothetical protein
MAHLFDHHLSPPVGILGAPKPELPHSRRVLKRHVSGYSITSANPWQIN